MFFIVSLLSIEQKNHLFAIKKKAKDADIYGIW